MAAHKTVKTKRPKHTAEELRELILVAARTLIEKEGLEGLSAREVARQVGYSPGTLYNVFKDRDDIILNIQARLLDALDQHLDGIADCPDPRRNVIALANGYLAFTQANPKLWNLLFEHRLANGAAPPTWYLEKVDGLMARIEAALKPLASDLKPAETERAARVLWAGVHGVSSLATAGRLANVTADAAQILVENLVTTYLQGLTAPASRPAQKAQRRRA